jgi:hypothetical protein
MTTSNSGQAEQPLATFFPPLPETIEDEGERPQRQPIPMPELTVEEIQCCLLKTKPWKAAGEDGLPAGVWRQVWPAVSESVRRLFQTSLDTGVIPKQWKVAKIIPLKKPNKDDYTLAKAWRPISLLSTLGKLLEAVVAERISFAVETYGLLPANHFGARKQRSAEQALLLLQERIYTAWRNKRVVSLVSFDVKGAHNGGKTAAENMDRLQSIVQRATEWESRSGASFEGGKTAFIHFTRNSTRQPADEPITASKGRRYGPHPPSRSWVWLWTHDCATKNTLHVLRRRGYRRPWR